MELNALQPRKKKHANRQRASSKLRVELFPRHAVKTVQQMRKVLDISQWYISVVETVFAL